MVLVRVAALSTAVLSTGNARDRPGIELWLLGGWVGFPRPTLRVCRRPPESPLWNHAGKCGTLEDAALAPAGCRAYSSSRRDADCGAPPAG
eukprot:COSAG03_NODE_1990_length_3254_cov_3.418384_2_plen_91_part_00